MRTEGAGRHVGWLLFAGMLGAALLCVGMWGPALASRACSQLYAGRIFPGVSVYGIALGGLTVEQAAAVLQSALPDPASLPLTVRSEDRSWTRSWADLGLHFDPLATARLAYEAGRGRTSEQLEAPGSSPAELACRRLRGFVAGWSLSPVVVLPDPLQATEALNALAPEVAIPGVNAGLIIQPDGVFPVPAQAGRELDVEETVARLTHTISTDSDGLVMQLLTRQVEPAIGNPGPAQAQAQALLAGPFTLVANDPLTGFSASWAVKPEAVARWLIARPVEPMGRPADGGAPPQPPPLGGGGEEARLVLAVQEEPLRTYLEDLGRQLTEEVALDVEGTLVSVRTAIETGENQADVSLVHPPQSYIVQPGDTLVSVAHAHGFPVWWLTQANPGVEPGALRPGQTVVIPSADVLFPLPLITGRRIVVDISDQHLYTYEGDTPVYDFVCSTGIASSPTITGTFQVLSKEEEAYASSWDLWMPHFLGIYRSGPDFTNGIHALPTLSSGARLWEGYLGHPVSYGCIVIGLDEGATLYEWAELGTLVVIQE